MPILAILVLASSHKIEETWHTDIHLLFVRKTTLPIRKFTLSQGVIDTGLASEVVGELASIAQWTIIFVIKLLADLLGGLWLDDLSFDGMREETVESVLAVAHVEMDAGVVAAVDVGFTALAGALIHCEVMLRAKVFYGLQLCFQTLVFQELLVVH
jgi:hypothetical protein